MTSRSSVRAFTLLEVLVAVAILGLGLTAILSAQTGLFASSSRTGKISFAVGLIRCRMTELELELVKNGLPIIDESEQGQCCEDESTPGYDCSWKVERVELPEPTSLEESLSSDEGGMGLGPLGALMSIGQSKGGVLGDDPSLGSLTQLMDDASMGGSQAMAPMLMSMVYPKLKPMLEASIRRVTVTVAWQEGSVDRDLTVTQFVTNPQQGGFDPLIANQLNDALGADGTTGTTGNQSGSNQSQSPGGGFLQGLTGGLGR